MDLLLVSFKCDPLGIHTSKIICHLDPTAPPFNVSALLRINNCIQNKYAKFVFLGYFVISLHG